MENLVSFGIFSLGFVFGYFLYYAIRHTKDFNIDALSSAAATLGGGAVVGIFGNYEGWIGPYGTGVAAGFLFYFVVAFVLIFTGKFKNVSDVGVMLAGPKLPDMNKK